MKRYTITEFVQDFLGTKLHPGCVCVDATMGNGHDTEFLCRRAGREGKVLGFDIQAMALENTKKRLVEAGLPENYKLIQDGHEHMGEYAEEESIDCIMFNFGYLPGGDHACMTKCETSIQAIESGLNLLKSGGIMSLLIYSGGDTGFEEKHAIIDYLKKVDQKKFVIIKSEFFNRPNNPPIPVFLVKA